MKNNLHIFWAIAGIWLMVMALNAFTQTLALRQQLTPPVERRDIEWYKTRNRVLEQELANCRLTCATWSKIRDHLMMIKAIHPEWVSDEVMGLYPEVKEGLPKGQP